MKEILTIVNKIINLKLTKDYEILFLSYFLGEELEIFLKPALVQGNFIKYCYLKGIRFGIIIMRYKNIKDFNTVTEKTKIFFNYVSGCGIDITHFFVLRGGKYRDVTSNFLNKNTDCEL